THQVTARLIGYAPLTQQVTVRPGQTATVEFSLQRQAVVMDEIVVTGYGAQRRVAITGSVASVNVDEANVGVITNVDDLIRGRVAGVNITQNGGGPGSGVQIRIRGGTSISASNEPLYVIDGVAIQNLATEAGGIGIGGTASLARNPLNLLNPNDIESITILKDAAASAIYGARAANGVILIETKHGQRDRSTFEYDSYVSWSTRARSLDLLTGDQYRKFIQEQVAAGNLLQASLDQLGQANTDWEREVTGGTAITHNHNVAFSGGTQSSQYRASFNYMKQEGVVIKDGLERFVGRLNGTQYAWNDRLRLRVNLTASHIENDYVQFQNTGGFEGAVFHNMVSYDPTQPVTVTGGEFFEIAGQRSARNPVALAEQIADFAKTTRVLGNIRAQLDIFSNLRGQLIVGVDRSESTRRIFLPLASPVGAEFNGRAEQRSRDLTNVTFQGLLTYSQRFGDEHDVEVVGGYEWQDFETDEFTAEARDFVTDAFGFDNLAAGAQLVSPRSFRTENKLIGFFGRLTYGFNDRYFLTAVIRRDGSTKFGANHKWATFPAVSASWRIGEEDFMQGGLFSELRLRAGWGRQGNEAVPAYASLLQLAPSDGDSYPFGDQKVVGVAAISAANPDLKWEETTQYNVAIDYGFSDNRISGTFEYYVKNTSDLLLEVAVPQPAVQSTRFDNVGKVRNRGLEASLDALLINRSNLTLEAGLVFARERNEVTDLGLETEASFINTGGLSGRGQSAETSQRLMPGFAVGTFFGPEFVGVNGAGQQLFNDYDANGNIVGQITAASLGPEDRVPIGDANPDFNLGLRSQMTWGRLDARFLVRAKQGQDVLNNTALVFATKSAVTQGNNFLASALDDATSVKEPAIFSSRFIEDGSFIRLENITVGYTFDLPRSIGSGRTARVYISADNLFLITGYSGYDPEVHSASGPGRIRVVSVWPRVGSIGSAIRVRATSRPAFGSRSDAG
ncbi:MAG: SusC/RagA family TonB-linked outer membrane protein, partial [Acidobacteria bacterium]|nr:SusC/RagA family TonB-linked outer membrane protein [Acidobacteriota bacterium]